MAVVNLLAVLGHLGEMQQVGRLAGKRGTERNGGGGQSACALGKVRAGM